MSTRKTKTINRSVSPLAERLETRELLSSLSTTPSASVSGIDTKGDHWTLTLLGPGTLNVVDSSGTAFTSATQFTHIADINTIAVSGTFTSQSRLVGKVTFVPTGSDGRVFFQQLTINNTGAYGHVDPALVRPRITVPQNGIAAVDMPNFWLGNTSGVAPTDNSNFHTSPTPFKLAGGINAPEGINTLRFGGVDARSLDTIDPTNNDEFVINLGPPIAGGTSIIVDKVFTDANTSTVSGTTTTFQHAVTFVVNGRINLFQANEIDGNTASGLVPTQFVGPPLTTTTATSLLPGGTFLVSDVGGGVTTGQIGDIRIGGNVSDFTAFVLDTDLLTFPTVDPQQGPQVSNFYIGGETNNVILVAPAGSRNVFFGRGMDNTFINTAFIQNLQANRDATNSAVTVKRTIGNMAIGGDVTNSFIQSGYDQELSAVANTPVTSVSGQPISAGGVFNGQAPPTIGNRILNPVLNQPSLSPPLAHGGGFIHGRIAGNVTNSIVSVSVDPNPSGIMPPGPGKFQMISGKSFPFGAPQNIVLPRGVLNLKVEGSVNVSGLQHETPPLVDPNVASTSAFFAKTVKLVHAPVIPPNVPEQPFHTGTIFHSGQRYLKGLFKVDNSVTLPKKSSTKR
jgi:hypothetical protein